jgi:hypothetical protein
MRYISRQMAVVIEGSLIIILFEEILPASAKCANTKPKHRDRKALIIYMNETVGFGQCKLQMLGFCQSLIALRIL